MAVFIRHGPCPRCHSKDNNAIYDDGSEWCFGCRRYHPAERNLNNSRKEEDSPIDISADSLDLSDNLPQKSVEWLKRYAITDEEILKWNIRWCESKSSLTLGQQFRYFGDNPNHPKAVSIPDREEPFLLKEVGGPIVMVEDYLSAIKVARVCNAYCLYGSNIPDKALNRVAKTFSPIGVWLDLDKMATGAKAVLRASAHGIKNVRQIITECDPKEYGTTAIARYLSKGGIL